MNCTTYIFGNLKQGYSQYPNDYARSVFEKMLQHCEATTQIVTHRKNDLMYYAYVRKCISNSTTIGLCIVFNSLMVENTSALFPLFEEAVAKMSTDGDVLTFSNDGDIVPTIDKLEESVQGQIERVRSYLLEKAVQIENGCVKLPPVSYGVDADVIKRFSINDKVEEIAEASYVYNYVYIGKNADFDNETIQNNRERIKEVNKERTKAEEKYKKVSGASKQKAIIVGSILTIIAFIISFFTFRSPYQRLEGELTSSTGKLRQAISLKNSVEQSIEIRSNSLKEIKKTHQMEMEKARKKLPFLITEIKIGNTDGDGNTETNFGGTIYSSSSMFITPQIKVYGLKNYTAKIDVKLYDAYGMMKCGHTSPIDASYCDTIRIKKGEHSTYTLKGWGSNRKGHWSSGRYKLEIWNSNKCLSKHRFTIN